MTTEIASNIDAGSKKPRRFQFGLRAMLVIVTLFALVFYWYSIRSCSIRFDNRVMIADAQSVQSLLSNHPSEFAKGDKHLKLLLNENELSKLTVGGMALPLLAQMDAVVDAREGYSFGGSFERFETAKSLTLTSGNRKLDYRGDMKCMAGSKYVGTLPYCRYDYDLELTDRNTGETIIQNIKYDGPVPAENIVYFIPIDNEMYYVFVVSLNPVD